MKRCWFGAGLLIVLLIVSLCVTWGMDKIHEPIAADLMQAAECAELGDWRNAEDFSRRAERAWKKWEHFRACFADHTPTEEVGAELAAGNGRVCHLLCPGGKNGAGRGGCPRPVLVEPFMSVECGEWSVAKCHAPSA